MHHFIDMKSKRADASCTVSVGAPPFCCCKCAIKTLLPLLQLLGRPKLDVMLAADEDEDDDDDEDEDDDDECGEGIM